MLGADDEVGEDDDDQRVEPPVGLRRAGGGLGLGVLVGSASIERLGGVVGTWLADFKFGSDRCALKLAGARGSLSRVQRLLPLAASAAKSAEKKTEEPEEASLMSEKTFKGLTMRGIGPALMALTRMLSLARWTTRHWVKLLMEALAAE